MDDKYNEAGLPIMENVGQGRARPTSECIYPNCEDCDKYHGHYCTVPMVVSKQIWLLTEALLVRMEKRLTELETLVEEAIFGSAVKSYTLRDKPITNPPEVKIIKSEEANFTWDDYLGEDQ